MRRTYLSLSLATLLLALVVTTSSTSGARAATTPDLFPEASGDATSPLAYELADLAWIAGHWGGEAFGGQVEEAWFSPAGRSMSGSFRLIQDDLAVMYELLLLEQDEDGEIYYRFKHVSRGWEPWEEEKLEYRLTELEGRKATFRPTSDTPPANAPAWFTYESPSSDRLTVTIHGGQTPIALEMRRR